MIKIILIGKGGHSNVVRNAIDRRGAFTILASIEESDDCKIVGDENQLAFIAIGDNGVRERLSKLNYNFNCNIIHPTASLWLDRVEDLTIGSYFGANSVVENGAKVGNFCIVNSLCLLEHDSVLGDFCHIAPGVVTGGRVNIGRKTMIGIGSIIKDGVHIGENVIVGMGSVVTKDIPSNQVWWGSPARFQRYNT